MPKPKEILLEQERHELKVKSGGGILSYEVWGCYVNGKTVVTRYNLAYINHQIYAGDNGRVLGFDNAHDYHHRHYLGQVESVEFTDYDTILGRFQKEWLTIVLKHKEAKS